MRRGLRPGEYVSQVGIEPTTRGLKVPCSTTELLARHRQSLLENHTVFDPARVLLVQEMASPGEDHRQAVMVRRLHDLIVAHGAARLYDGLNASLRQRLDAVGEREEGVACGDRTAGTLSGFLDRDLR